MPSAPTIRSHPAKASRVVDLAFELDPHADLLAKPVQQLQQTQASDGGKSIAVDAHHLVAVDDALIGPRFHFCRQGREGSGIVRLEELQCPFRKDEAESECGVRRIALDDVDVALGVAPLHEKREVKAGRPRPDDSDTHACSLFAPVPVAMIV